MPEIMLAVLAVIGGLTLTMVLVVLVVAAWMAACK